MWTADNIDRWIGRLIVAQGRDYRNARNILLEVRNEIGDATVTETQKQKRARYLAKKAQRKTRNAGAVARATA